MTTPIQMIKEGHKRCGECIVWREDMDLPPIVDCEGCEFLKELNDQVKI
jgi:hypothetical protein